MILGLLGLFKVTVIRVITYIDDRVRLVFDTFDVADVLMFDSLRFCDVHETFDVVNVLMVCYTF